MRFKEIRKRLALWLYPVDSVELVRNHYSLSVGSKAYSDMDTEEQERLCANATLVLSNPSFKIILNYLTKEQEQNVSYLAPSWESVLIGRGSINGFCRVLEEFEQKAQIHQESLRKDQYDKHDIL